MAEHEKDKQVDELLDQMLSQYAAVEPRPGLETRVLARIAESRRRRPVNVWHWLLLGTGAAAIAAIVIVLLVSTQSRSNNPAPTISQTQQQSSPQFRLMTPEMNGVPRPAVGRRKRSIRRARVVEVRQDVFPSPEPLSQQEKLMLRYLSATPRQELLTQSHPDPFPDDGALRDESQPQY